MGMHLDPIARLREHRRVIVLSSRLSGRQQKQ